MLTKLRYAAGEGNSESSSGETSGSSSGKMATHGLQIIGMSATMPNVAAVADWLQVRYLSFFMFLILYTCLSDAVICGRKNITNPTEVQLSVELHLPFLKKR